MRILFKRIRPTSAADGEQTDHRKQDGTHASMIAPRRDNVQSVTQFLSSTFPSTWIMSTSNFRYYLTTWARVDH